MSSVGEMELVAMPGTDDMHVVLIVCLAKENAAFADKIDDLRHPQPLARRTSLMRTKITIGVVFVRMSDDADLDVSNQHQAYTAFRNFTVFTNAYFRHNELRSFYTCRRYYGTLWFRSIGIRS